MADEESVDALVQRLGLEPHPEGGFYKETYRSLRSVPVSGRERAFSTAIYFLLRRGEVSHLHRIGSDEVWHFYTGSPLRVVCLGLGGRGRTDLLLGTDFANGYAPQAVVPGGTWFGAMTEGDWSLVGCTVSPGFDFADFELGDREVLAAAFPGHAAIIDELTP